MSSTIKRTIKGGAYFFASNVVTKTLGFLFIIISSRYLGPHEFGILSLGLSISGIAKNIGSFGLPVTIQRFLSGKGEGDRVDSLYSGILILFLIISLIFSLSLFGFSSYISNYMFNEPGLTFVLQVFAIGLVVEIGFQIYRAILQSQEHVKEILLGSTAYSFLKILSLIVVIIWSKEAFSAAIAIEFAASVGLIYFVVVASRLPFKIDLPARKDVKKVLSYSLPLVFVGFSYFIAQQTDRIMLGWLSTSSDVGIYTISSTLALIMTTLHGSLVSIFMPLASKAYRDRNMEELNKAYLFISKWVGFINGIVSLLFAGIGIILLEIFGTEYPTDITYQILIVLTILYFIGTWVGPTGALLQMADGHKIEMYNTAIYLILNIGFNYLFILNYGLVGAAWGTLLSGLIRNILQVLEILYYYKLNVINSTSIKLFLAVIGGIGLCLLLRSYSLYISLIFIGLTALLTLNNISKLERKILNNFIGKYV